MCISCNPNSHHNPINCIIPPHMLRVLTMRGDKATAKMAHALLRQNDKIREERSEQPSGRMVPVKDGATGTFVTATLAEASTAPDQPPDL